MVQFFARAFHISPCMKDCVSHGCSRGTDVVVSTISVLTAIYLVHVGPIAHYSSTSSIAAVPGMTISMSFAWLIIPATSLRSPFEAIVAPGILLD